MDMYNQGLIKIKEHILSRNDKIKIYGLITGRIMRIIDLTNIDISSLNILDIMDKDHRTFMKSDLIHYIYILQDDMRTVDLRCLIRKELLEIIFDILNDQGRIYVRKFC